MKNPIPFFFKERNFAELEEKLNKIGENEKKITNIYFQNHDFEWLEIHWEYSSQETNYKLEDKKGAVELYNESDYNYVYRDSNPKRGVNIYIDGCTYYLLEQEQG